MKTLTFTAPTQMQTTTTIVVGSGALQEIPTLLQSYSQHHVVLLFDEAVTSIAERVTESLSERTPLLLPVKSGDASKSLTEVEQIVSRMLAANCSRSTLLIAVGGGMLTDLGGFIASVFMRGIPSLLVPTSVLAMVDAAIGGKTAVNNGTKKNMIGTITQPVAVVCDVDLALPLSPKLLSEGLVEVVKIAAIADADFFAWLEENLPRVLAREVSVLTECIASAISLKLRIVAEDTHDDSLRLHLNFGHTIAHALEAVSSFALSHGEAVAIGMALEMRLLKTPEALRVNALVTALGMPTEIPPVYQDCDALWSAMRVDKKSDHGSVRIVAPTVLGEGMIATLTYDQFRTMLS